MNLLVPCSFAKGAPTPCRWRSLLGTSGWGHWGFMTCLGMGGGSTLSSCVCHWCLSLLHPSFPTQSPTALSPEGDSWGGCAHKHTCARSRVQTGHSTVLLCKTLLLHCDCPCPFPCFHLPEMSQHHPDHHHAKPVRAGLRPCSSFLWSVSRLLFTAMRWQCHGILAASQPVARQLSCSDPSLHRESHVLLPH